MPLTNPILLGRTAQRRHDLSEKAFGPMGHIAGTLQIEGAPARRRVRCIERKTGRFVGEVWSASNGSYRFDDLAPSRAYQIIAMDYELTYNAVIADNVLAVSGGPLPSMRAGFFSGFEVSSLTVSGGVMLIAPLLFGAFGPVILYRSDADFDNNNLPQPISQAPAKGGVILDSQPPAVPRLYYRLGIQTRDGLVLSQMTTAIPGEPVVASFDTAGAFSWTPPPGVSSGDVLILAGGGGGEGGAAGNFTPGGGGGAGGLRLITNFAFPGSLDGYVGDGGAGGVGTASDEAARMGQPGGDSWLGDEVATGGGGADLLSLRDGGSGAGTSSTDPESRGLGVPGQGHDGGYRDGPGFNAGGGGGADGPGGIAGAGEANVGGGGGAGLTLPMFGAAFAAGGGGGLYQSGTLGTTWSIAGAGGEPAQDGQDAQPGYGSGGGGGGTDNTAGGASNGGQGGRGTVKIRYVIPAAGGSS